MGNCDRSGIGACSNRVGDKAFDETLSRGLALTLGDAVAYAENHLREALAAIKETGRSEQ